MTKLWLVEGFCPVDQYHCLMPVEYTAVKEDSVIQSYAKDRMACRHALADKCDNIEECEFYKNAPDVLDKGVNWYEP